MHARCARILVGKVEYLASQNYDLNAAFRDAPWSCSSYCGTDQRMLDTDTPFYTSLKVLDAVERRQTRIIPFTLQRRRARVTQFPYLLNRFISYFVSKAMILVQRGLSVGSARRPKGQMSYSCRTAPPTILNLSLPMQFQYRDT